ncbi:hypothetical protein O0I10_001153 [Lichtheimia ornata]|uniref:Uncharacterized protein n=1 Tax=Lichtheimia ornata TaxID=688661 RepID=A0AAD7Y391_9FUNG|nr:uncharacterized protein O0I10_001153 [Lichtheimia ornata]KAJ8662977.1 hypothetical protein O0I10_001153 [Lichtheimia ornata]
MSASVAGSSTPSPLRDWLLPMPQDIGIDDSFSNDLIRQFDKKRSRLRVEMMQQSGTAGPAAFPPPPLTDSEDNDSISTSSPQQPSPQQQQRQGDYLQQRRRQELIDQEKEKRRRSAGDLLRRSSAYLRAKIDAFRGSTRSHDNLRERYSSTTTTPPPPPPAAASSSPSKLVVNTTIAIPQFNTSTQQSRFLSPAAAAIQPPVITQYPPKPLKYSPIDPPSDDTSSSSRHGNNKRHHGIIQHRISLPALRVVGRASGEPRRRSDVGVGRQQQKKTSSSGGGPGDKKLPFGAFNRKGKERATASSAPPTLLNNGTCDPQQQHGNP